MDPQAIVFLVVLLLYCISDGGVVSFNLEPTIPVIKRGENSSYFGFSVAQHADSNGNLWILVGAPLGQNLQPATNRSGALWKCPITGWEGDCEQVVTDGKRDDSNDDDNRLTDSEQLYPPTPDELKDGQWLGVNVRSQGAGRKVMVCAHRYVHQGKDFRWGNGLCHFLHQDLRYDRSLDPCRGKAIHGLEGLGFCQVGTSAALLDDDTALLGAPGAMTARGLIYGISVSDNFLTRDRNQYKSPFDFLDKYSYMGMAVDGGKFFDDSYSYVSGAPKAANFSGQVVFFEKDDGTEHLRVRTAITGEGFASSFGYELATLDLNNDGRPDLVVGAPFYVDKRGAGGAAYIYLNPEGGFSETTRFIRLTGPSESRFGYSISSIGDLNKDRYQDLAIGAPYADDGHGRVYIYLGNNDGVIREPSQIIRASENFPFIRTFGFSLSGGMDLDNNTYPDLLVGAYETDSTVLLRSRPIIGIKTEVFGNLTDIDPNSSGCKEDPDSEEVCFNFKACFEIQEMSRVLSASLHIESMIEAETFVEGKKFSRVRFRNGLSEKEQVVKHHVNVKQNEPKGCSTEVVYLKKNVRDIQSPIAFKLTYKLVQKAPTYRRNNPQLPNIQNYPILNQQEASKVFVARFAKDCGDNEICESDVAVRAWTDLPVDESQNYQIILGERTEIVINIDVQNYGEPAYEANLYIRHPKSMPFGGRITNTSADSILCSPASNDKNLVACSLGNPYTKKTKVALKLRFGSNLKDIEAHLSFDIWVNSTSLEDDAGNNRQQINATVIKKAELAIYGSSDPPKVYYGGKITGESAIRNYSEIGPRIVHEFTILNSGPWKAAYFQVIISWPHQVENKRPQGKWLLYPESIPMVEGDVVCKVPPNSIDVLRLRTKRSVASEDEEDEWVVASQTERGADGRSKTYVEMNCVRGTAKCIQIECDVRNLLAGETAVIKIHSRLWNGTLLEDYSQVDEVRIRSRAEIRILDDNRQDPVDDKIDVLTTCLPDLKFKVDLEGIAWWIYALSIIAGVLLLLLIIYCLYKSGFFKRRRPEPTHTASIVKS